jgi:hypothetical protein
VLEEKKSRRGIGGGKVVKGSMIVLVILIRVLNPSWKTLWKELVMNCQANSETFLSKERRKERKERKKRVLKNKKQIRKGANKSIPNLLEETLRVVIRGATSMQIININMSGVVLVVDVIEVHILLEILEVILPIEVHGNVIVVNDMKIDLSEEEK